MACLFNLFICNQTNFCATRPDIEKVIEYFDRSYMEFNKDVMETKRRRYIKKRSICSSRFFGLNFKRPLCQLVLSIRLIFNIHYSSFLADSFIKDPSFNSFHLFVTYILRESATFLAFTHLLYLFVLLFSVMNAY